MTFDREKAREVLRDYYGRFTDAREGMALDALAGCVTDEPQALDRDALHPMIAEAMGYEFDTRMPSVTEVEDRILALLRPDPRIAQIEALCDRVADLASHRNGVIYQGELRAILRGEG